MATYETPRVGQLRPSQLMYTYGVGAIVDLPNLSVMVMGIDDWPTDPGIVTEITEDRLLAAVKQQLGAQVQRLLSPPIAPETGGPPNPFEAEAQIGVPVAPFPRWMLCPSCRMLAPIKSGLFELKTDPYHPDRARYVHVNCPRPGKPPTVLPVRFLVACEDGHLDDFPWREFAHGGPTPCNGTLKLTEYGPSGEARDLEVSCSCGARRVLAQAFGFMGKATMPRCRGRRPHLRDFEDEGCERQSKAILLGASNAYFPLILTTLAIPGAANRLDQIVEDHWHILTAAQNQAIITAFRSIGQLSAFVDFTDTEIWDAVERRRHHLQSDEEDTAEEIDLKTPEWNMLIQPESAPATEDFLLRRTGVPPSYSDTISQIVLAERLREVNALIGFTRIDSPGELGEPAEIDQERRSPICKGSPTWVPATEVRGEGIFIQFNESRIADWLSRDTVKKCNVEFHISHQQWRRVRGIDPPEANFPTIRYVLLHSFAHALMRQLALECGYTAASIRERIYCRAADQDGGPMAGILIYTAAPDSQGTLGGLVDMGDPVNLGRHINRALANACLCSSDPLCAEQSPDQQGRALHAAACHACMFAPETSCERGNKYLDRSVLVPTVDQQDLAFFQIEGVSC